MSAPVLFQFMPPLLPSEYEALTSSIREHGVQVPVLVDENGAIIDGHHRDQIAAELGIECPREVRSGLTDAQKRTLAISLNKDRRHLTREQVRALIAESVKADPQLSNREHARRVGVHHETVRPIRAEMEARGEIRHVSDRTDSLGRQQPATKPAPVVTVTVEHVDVEGVQSLHTSGSDASRGQVSQVGSPEPVALTLGELPIDGPLDVTDWTTEEIDLSIEADEWARAKREEATRKITGLDGKTYTRPAAEPRTPNRRPITEAFESACRDLDRLTMRIHILVNDDRMPRNAKKVARHRNDLLRARDLLQQDLEQLDAISGVED